MPYFVFRMTPRGALRLLQAQGAYPDYAAALSRTRALRAQAADGETVRMIFADNELQAEELLGEIRPATGSVAEDD